MIEREAVLWGYRYLLLREPENDTVLDHHSQAASWRVFRETLVDSEEYRLRRDNRLPDAWVLADVFSSRKIWLNLADKWVSLACLWNDYEANETETIKRLLGPDDAFLDIGANIGWYSILASTILGVDGKIAAFEPRPDTFDHMAASLALTDMGDRAQAYQFGLADRGGTIQLGWSKNTANPGGSSFMPGHLPDSHEGSEIALRTLDSLNLDRCDVIKMDIEGAELSAMRGARETLLRHRPIILSEVHGRQLRAVSNCSPAEYVAYLNDLGFNCLAIFGAEQPGKHLEASDFADDIITNIVFAPTERADWVSNQLRTPRP